MIEISMHLRQLNISEPDEKAADMIRYMDEILMANKNVNLTAITDREEFISKHIIDSLSCANLSELAISRSVVDVGSGGGFPGVPLAIAFPEKDFTLLDSQRKKLDIVRDICQKLEINNITTIHGRAEDYGRSLKSGSSEDKSKSDGKGEDNGREAFDLCVSRAVANMSTLCELCLPLVRPGGHFIAYKGENGREETDAAAKAIRTLGGRIKKIIRQERTEDMKNHSLVIIEKISETDLKYPRRAGKPEKDPIR